MALDIPQEFRLAKNTRFQAAPWIWLLEVEVPTSPPQVIRICNHTKEVSFDSDGDGNDETFTPAQFEFGELRMDTEGSLPSLPLTVANVTREALAVLLNNDFLVEKECRLTLVNANTVDNADAKIAFTLEVRQSSADEQAITFNLSSYSLNSVVAPRERMQRSVCVFTYGGPSCGFDIAGLDPGLANLGLCPKTEEGCTLRGDAEVAAGRPREHPNRIGLFKGLPLSGN